MKRKPSIKNFEVSKHIYKIGCLKHCTNIEKSVKHSDFNGCKLRRRSASNAEKANVKCDVRIFMC
jgi:hypothetical protein